MRIPRAPLIPVNIVLDTLLGLVAIGGSVARAVLQMRRFTRFGNGPRHRPAASEGAGCGS